MDKSDKRYSWMPLRVFTSNRLEILAQVLARELRPPLPSPLDGEVIVVQSKGMERWVSMEIARRYGICANFRFPFPNHFVRELFRKTMGDLPERSLFDPEASSWLLSRLWVLLILLRYER